MPSADARGPCIAFSRLASHSWTAGLHYQRNLFAALHALGDERPNIALVLPEGADPGELAEQVDRTLPYTHRHPRFVERWVRRGRKVIGLEAEALFSTFLRGQGVEAFFCVSEFGPRFRVPLLSWIADFQHLHLPHMFSDDERASLDDQFGRIARHADLVVVSSHDARRDFERFAPESASKARVLSFVAQIPDGVYGADPAVVCERYGLPERFVYLPNQFWKHKNHLLVLKALAQLKASRPEVTVVCTGNTHDHRNPRFFSELLFTVSELGLRDRFIILGRVPYEHLFQLVRQSLAVLQPSLFEGWSTTVEECRSIGKGMILSDIPILREQNPPSSLFFDPEDPDQLAQRLVQVYDSKRPGPDHALEAAAKEDLPKRTAQYGRTFVTIAREAMGMA